MGLADPGRVVKSNRHRPSSNAEFVGACSVQWTTSVIAQPALHQFDVRQCVQMCSSLNTLEQQNGIPLDKAKHNWSVILLEEANLPSILQCY